jgi:sugar phosphate isomerase/epimerase
LFPQINPTIAMKAIALLLALAVTTALAAPEFYVMDNGVGRGSWTPEQQAKTLKELGYAGISYNYTRPEDLAAWQSAFKAQGLKIFGIYAHTTLDAAKPFDPRLPEAIKMLKGTGTVLWLTVQATKVPGDHDAQAVKTLQQLADLAAASEVRCALYGHAGFYVATSADSARMAAKVQRPNFAATLNLCHEFLTGQGGQLDKTLKEVAPVAGMATINGIDVANKKYLLRLDQGDLDLGGYLKKLAASGYHGPIGLQCYSVPGDVKENLTINIATWRKIAEGL